MIDKPAPACPQDGRRGGLRATESHDVSFQVEGSGLGGGLGLRGLGLRGLEVGVKLLGIVRESSAGRYV